METLNESKINRKEYRIALRRSSEFIGNKMAATGKFYLFLQGVKGKISLSKESIQPLGKAFKEISEGKIPLMNEKPMYIHKDFVITGTRRYAFDKDGNRNRTGSAYFIVTNPAGRKIILDESVIKSLSEDLLKLKIEMKPAK